MTMNTSTHHDDIAIIGMACRVSGANNSSELWDMLVRSEDMRHEIDRYHSAGFYASAKGTQSGLTNVKNAYLLQDGIDKFDNAFFQISPTEAVAMDPQHRIMLEVAYEAFENAGITLDALDGHNTAVFSAISGSDYATSLLRDIDALPKYHSTGASIAMAANKISYYYNLRGPSMVIDTACSSSTSAINQAILSIKSGDCKMALVTGANLILSPDMFVHMSSLGFLSPTGICHSFDSLADGYARGEGVLAIVLKPLSQALTDGDPVRSIIRGHAVNQDGRTSGITLPSTVAQKENMDRVYTSSGIDPSKITYLEAHGTGTMVGDTIEISAINQVFGRSFRQHKLVVGSVKSSVGHLEAGAALIGIIKTVECLEHGQIPPQKNFLTPNPRINFSKILIPTELLSWPDQQDGPRYASVNSFGFGGTNGHILLEHWPSSLVTSPHSPERPYVFKISASNHTSLHALAKKYADFISSNQPDLQMLAYTTLSRRSTLANTQYLIASSNDELAEKLRSDYSIPIWNKQTFRDPLGFIFTGQGAQWPGMGRSLLASSKLFQTIIDQCDSIINSLSDRPNWRIHEQLLLPAESSLIHTPAVSQTVCTALQIGLVEIWKSWGVAPKFLIGHSSGEIAACYATGVYSIRNTILTAYYRGKYVQELVTAGPVSGAMCAVGLGEKDCTEMIMHATGYATIAAVNSPSNCTVSGDQDTIEEIINNCKEDKIYCKRLKVDVAYHSLHMCEVAEKYQNRLENVLDAIDVSAMSLQCDIFSTVLDRQMSAEDISPLYWKKNLCHTVRFSSAVMAATRSYKSFALVEIGPHSALKAPVTDTLSRVLGHRALYFHSCQRGISSIRSMLDSVVEMMASGVKVDSYAVNNFSNKNHQGANGAVPKVLTNLPTYTWDHTKSHWGESRASMQLRFREFARHPILGSRAFGDNPNQMLWRNCPTLEDLPLLGENFPLDRSTTSVAFCILMSLEATRQAYGNHELKLSTIRFTNLEFHSPIPLSAILVSKIETCLSLIKIKNSNSYMMTISALPGDSDSSWKVCCSGTTELIGRISPPEEPDINHHVKNTNIFRYIKLLGIFQIDLMHDMCINCNQVTGTLPNQEKDSEPLEQFRLLAAVLQVPEILAMSSNSLIRHGIERIESLQVQLAQVSTKKSCFQSKQTRLSATRHTSVLTYLTSEGMNLKFEGIQTKGLVELNTKPPLQSIFLQPQILPDISCINNKDKDKNLSMDVTSLLQLVLHKWPMCDIGIGDILPKELNQIETAIIKLTTSERRKYRSLRLIHPSHESHPRLEMSTAFGKEQLHLVFGTISWTLSNISKSSLPGLVCVRFSPELDKTLFTDSFDLISLITGVSKDDWALGRPKLAGESSNGARDVQLHIYTTLKSDIARNVKQRGKSISMINISEGQIDENHLPSYGGPHIIVLDCAEMSILVDIGKSKFLTWLQPLLAALRSLVWVTRRTKSNPFSDVASSFIKTILSEYPLLRGTNLVIEDPSPSTNRELDLATEVHERLMDGCQETEITIRNSQIFITRYQPDDTLSASVGIIPPRRIYDSPDCHFWEVIPTVSQQVCLRVDRRPRTLLSKHRTVLVDVHASVIDHLDVVLVQDIERHQGKEQQLGHFFSGTVRIETQENSTSLKGVVGCCIGSHTSQIYTDNSKLYDIPAWMNADQAAIHFAAYCLSLAIIDGAIRPLAREKVSIQILGILGEALRKVCISENVALCDQDSPDCNFVASFDIYQGFLVNNQPVNVTNYIECNWMEKKLPRFMHPHFILTSQVQAFSLYEVQLAFTDAIKAPGSILLSREKNNRPTNLWMSETPSTQLFKPTVNYIIVGGLGGLGQHFMFWMISRGAKHLVSLTRRGMNSPGADKVVRRVHSLGATIEILAVDACDRHALQNAIAHIRRSRSISGYFNMSMQLANSPLSTMTSEKWMNAVSNKIQSSWNLHEISSEDNLDIFIMFSSISSILGNRAQGNYAVGNSFQNSLARYRKSCLGLPGLSVVLGAIRGLGAFAEDSHLIETLSRSGLYCYDSNEFEKIVEAAILESYASDRSLIVTGLQRFQNINGEIRSDRDQTQIFWSDWAEFSCLFDYERTNTDGQRVESLLEQIKEASDSEQLIILYLAFSKCLGNVLGRDSISFTPETSIAACGLDSLNTVACRYWFFKELHLDIPIFQILAATTIKSLLLRVLVQFKSQSLIDRSISCPEPVHHVKESLDYRPISHSQQRMWFLQHFIEDKTLNNLLLECQVVGQIDLRAFSQAWSIFLRRHESTSSPIVYTPHGVQQIPSHKSKFPLSVLESPSDEFEGNLKKVRQDAQTHIFDLEAGDLVRGWLILSSAGESRFFLASHHIAWDRASVNTIFKETTTIYKSIKNHRNPTELLASDPYQMIDYTIWQNAWLAQANLVKPQLSYWKKKLAGLPKAVSLLPMACVSERPVSKKYRFRKLEMIIPKARVGSMHLFCQQHSITSFMFMASTLTLLVSRLTGDLDIAVGIADGDRGHSAFDDLVGFTVNLLAIRTKLDVSARYLDFLETFRENTLEAYQYKALPFDFLLQKLNIARSTSHSQIFQIVVNYQTAGDFKDCDYGDFRLTNYTHYNAKPQSDFQLDVEETANGELRCFWTYDISLYSSEAFYSFSNSFCSLLTEILQLCPEARISDLHFQSQRVDYTEPYCGEKDNDIKPEPQEPNEETFLVLLEKSIEAHPDKIAITDENASITYQTLDLYTSRLVKYFIAENVKPGARVGIYCEEGMEMAIAIYGTLRAGLTYVPIGTELPRERIKNILQDAEINLVLTGDRDRNKLFTFADLEIESCIIQQVENLIHADINETSSVMRSSHDTASQDFCCIFTSGTTGLPKGVLIGRRQLQYQMQSYYDYLETNDTDKILLASSISFDMSLTSIYGTILRGATLVIASRESRYSATQLLEFAIKNKVTVVTLTTTQLKFLLAEEKKLLSKWKCLKILVVGGEYVPPWVVLDFYSIGLPAAVLYNGYGPTETTVCNSLSKISRVDQQQASVSIGKPLFPARYFLLDENMELVGQDIPGELYIGGPIVNCYLNTQASNKAAFVYDCTQLSTAVESVPSVLYRTGDMALVTQTGEYHILGRVNDDRQVKIRGMRTELWEIENSVYAVLKAIDEDMFGISLVVVVYYPTESVLAAYMMASGPRIEKAVGEKNLFRTIRSKLMGKLPSYMIPSKMSVVPTLPQTATGKTDYKKILELPLDSHIPVTRLQQRSNIEQKETLDKELADIWREVLGTNTDLSLDDDFFSIGGHSLLLLRVQRKIFERFGAQIALVDIFTNSNLHSLTRLVSIRVAEEMDAGLVKDEPGDPSTEMIGNGDFLSKNSEGLHKKLDWDFESLLPESVSLAHTYQPHLEVPRRTPLGVAIVGACTMAGAHLLAHLLTTTSLNIHCIGVESIDSDPHSSVLQKLKHWGLLGNISTQSMPRISAYTGSLAQHQLGLSEEEMASLRVEVNAIYVMDSDVSLLKRYEDLRSTNVESLKFVLSLACSSKEKPMAVLYLSTWGVPHLQTWKGTNMLFEEPIKTEVEMAHMKPEASHSLGYLKARWVCEKMLCQAASLGLPVTIFRSCMCGSSRLSNAALDRTDINRRILEGILQTGLVPNIGGDHGGGMSWISADFLVESMVYFAKQSWLHSGRARIYHIVSENHISYKNLAKILKTSHRGIPLTVVEPQQWFTALKARGSYEMMMQAEVIETWIQAGWLPFQLEATSTLAELRRAGIVPPLIEREFLMKHVIGTVGF